MARIEGFITYNLIEITCRAPQLHIPDMVNNYLKAGILERY
jgi:hypothetical protein